MIHVLEVRWVQTTHQTTAECKFVFDNNDVDTINVPELSERIQAALRAAFVKDPPPTQEKIEDAVRGRKIVTP